MLACNKTFYCKILDKLTMLSDKFRHWVNTFISIVELAQTHFQ